MSSEKTSLRRGLLMLRESVRMHPRPFSIGIGGAILFAVATVASSVVLARIIDRVIEPAFDRGTVSTPTVAAAAVVVVMIGVIRSVGVILRRSFATSGAQSVAATLRSRLVDQLARRPMSWFDERSSGQLLAHAGADVDAVVEALGPLPLSASVAVLIVISGISMINADVAVGALATAMFPALTLINVAYQRRIDRPTMRAQAELGVLTEIANESIDGAIVIKAFGAAAVEEKRFADQADRLMAAKIAVVRQRALFETGIFLVPQVCTIALLTVGAARVHAGHLSVGRLSGILFLFTLLGWPLRVVGYMLGDMTHGVAGWDRLHGLLSTPDAPATPHQSASSGFAAELCDVRFSYDDKRTVLDGVDWQIPKGKIVALVGATGSGKSTLLHILAGLRPVTSGVVRTDGAPGQLVFQEPFLFAGSIAANVNLAGTLAPGVVRSSLHAAQTDSFVGELVNGIDTTVGERGVTLSGGQRQRIALARMFARPAPLVLIDDATSSLDPATEVAVLDAIRTSRGEGSVVLVASRPSALALADQVAFLQDGRIVAVGSHDELFAQHAGYRDLAEAYQPDRS